MFYIEHRKFGYVVLETEDLESARADKKSLGRAFRIVDENGNEYR